MAEEGGNIKEFRYDQGLWCCKSSTENCTLDGEAKTVNCRGKALNLTEQCHGQDPSIPVCNHYGSDERRNGDVFKGAKRSHFNICNDNR
jgi:hypothetical protein